MIKNFFKITFRNMLKYRAYSLLNIVGLSVGLSICLLLFLWIKDELSYDRFHSNSDRIFRSEWHGKYGENSWETPMVPVPLAASLKSEFPEVEQATQLYPGRLTIKKGEEFVREHHVLFVDEAFFEVFDIQSVAGELSSVANNPNAILLTTASAERYFGKDWTVEQVIGQNIEQNNGKEYEIIGIVEGFPKQSHLEFNFIASLKNLQHIEQRKTQWSSAAVHTYFLLEKQGNPQQLGEKLQAYVDEYIVDQELLDAGGYARFPFQRIDQIHLEPNRAYIWIFGLVAGFILLLGCVNFINLATARALTRAKEVGVRKVLGSSQQQLMRQFFGESSMYVILSIIIAIGITQLAIPAFNTLTEKELTLNLFSSFFTWGLLLSLLVITALLTGTVPAFVLSAFSPIKAIKNQIAQSNGKNRLRQGLVVFQFCISIGLIIATLVVNRQLNFLQTKQLGFDQEQVLILRRANGLGQKYYPFLQRLESLPQVKSVSSSQFLPGDEFDSTIFIPEQPATFKETSLSYVHVDMNFAQTLDLEILEGRDFNPAFSTDSSGYLLNETAAAKLGWDTPIGKKITYGGAAEGRVIGIVKDFNFQSLHEAIEPLVLRMGSYKLPNIFIRLEGNNLRDQVQSIRDLWQDTAPEAPFEFAFLDEEISSLYAREERMSSIFTLFTSLAIFIACLGLLGLAAFMAQQRTKEIGIRKVLGASVMGILQLLSKDFIKLVFIALLIAGPVAWYLMNNWLDNFAYHVQLQWWIFLVAAALALSVAILTISFQSIRVATANPINALRDE